MEGKEAHIEDINMKAKFINENISDVLKPKNLIDKLYYISSHFLSWPAFIIKITNVGSVDSQQYGLTNIISEFACEVVINEHMIEGADFFALDSGDIFNLDEQDFIYYEFKELDDEVITAMNQEIQKLENKKKIIEKLINES